MLMDKRDKCLLEHPDYSFDEACLNIFNLYNNPVEIYGQYVECDGCDNQLLASIPAQNFTSLLINTKYAIRMHFVHNESVLCPWNQDLLEHYRYDWNLTNSCQPLHIKEEADNAYIPILTAYIIFIFFGTLWYMIKCIYKCTRGVGFWSRYIFRSSDMENDLGSTTETPLVLERPPAKKHPKRMKSLDVFRGFIILLMIFVNYGGGQYWIFMHSVWNGLTIADLVFPCFMWIMGFSMHLSFASKLRRAMPRRQLIAHVLKRSLMLILVGLALNSHGKAQPLTHLRFFGVLQRLGLCYLIVGLVEASLAKRNPEESRGWLIPDLISAWIQWLIMIVLLIVHTCIIFLVDVPGCGRGYLGPGGLHDHEKYQNCTGGVTGYVDRKLLGDHIYVKGVYQQVYETDLHFDPEGLLGTLTAAFLVFLGVHAGRVMSVFSNTKDRLLRLVLCGIVLCLFGAALCDFSKNGGVIPINKRLMSLSFATLMGGLACLCFIVLHLMVDVYRKWGGRPFFYPGMNPLVLYICHSLFANTFPFAWVPSSATHAAYLGMNLWATVVWLCFSIYLYKSDIFISI